MAIENLRTLIRSLQGSHTILISTHLLYEVDLLCSEMTIIQKGRIVRSGEMESIEKSFEARQIIQVEVANWNKHIRDEMKRAFSFENMEQTPCDGYVDLKFYFKQDQDLRKELSEFFINKNCGLLSFKRKRMNVEDIFRLTTGDGT